jgi:DNA-damage-inducible protein D
VGSKVRKTIKELGGTMPEDLPVAGKGMRQLEKERNQKSTRQLGMNSCDSQNINDLF